MADAKNDLLPVFGLDGGAVVSAGPTDGDGADHIDQEARASVERFQKLCRDAKRRAIGS